MEKAFEIGFGKTEKEITIDELPITGKVPEWLTGDLIRNGPGTFSVGKERFLHWFDGLAMLHRFSFDKGKVSYQNKFLESKAYHEAMEKKKIVYAEFATNPESSLLDRFKSIFKSPMTDSAKVNIAQIGDKTLALSETPTQMAFDKKTLASLGAFHYDSKINRHVTTVHPQYDHLVDKNYNLTTRFNRVSRYRIVEIGESQKPKLVCSIPTQEISYMHSFGMSPHYFTITEFPFCVNPLKIVFSGKPFIANYEWKPERGTVFHVIDRRKGKVVAKLKAEAFFAFHHINSFEKDGLLYVDIAAYKDADVVKAFYLDTIKANQRKLALGEFRRYKIDLEKKDISYEAIGGYIMELPRFDHANYSMQDSYRFVYGVGVNEKKPLSFYNQLVKLDIQKKTSIAWFEEGCYPGEGVFVGRPGKEQEDDGVLLSVVLNEEKGTSFLLVLDAATLKEIARAEVPHQILFGYHGEVL
jgi:beta,beta-carotene 9',10'-dioxygenase